MLDATQDENLIVPESEKCVIQEKKFYTRASVYNCLKLLYVE